MNMKANLCLTVMEYCPVDCLSVPCTVHVSQLHVVDAALKVLTRESVLELAQ